MVLLCALSGLSRRFQRCDLWLRPPSSSLSVVSCRDTCGRLRLRELIRWRDPGSCSLNRWKESKEHRGNSSAASRGRQSIYNYRYGVRPAVCVLYISIGVTLPLRVRQHTLLLHRGWTHQGMSSCVSITDSHKIKAIFKLSTKRNCHLLKWQSESIWWDHNGQCFNSLSTTFMDLLIIDLCQLILD